MDDRCKQLMCAGSRVQLNWSAHTDMQHKNAASRRVLHAGGLQRYEACS